MLTSAELDVLEHSAEMWNAFLLLPEQHPDDVTEFRHKLHDLQRIILARPSVRQLSR